MKDDPGNRDDAQHEEINALQTAHSEEINALRAEREERGEAGRC